MNLPTKWKQVQTQRMKTCGCQGGGVWEGGIGSLRLADELLYIEWTQGAIFNIL